MQRFRKRLRLLTEKHGGVLQPSKSDALTVTFATGTARFSSLNYEFLHCNVTVGDTSFPVRAPKPLCFDITSRLASPYLSRTLRNYQPGALLELSDCIRDEHGGPSIEQLKERLAANPSLTQAHLGGNRILAEYFHGFLFLCDNLCTDATNVVEF